MLSIAGNAIKVVQHYRLMIGLGFRGEEGKNEFCVKNQYYV